MPKERGVGARAAADVEHRPDGGDLVVTGPAQPGRGRRRVRLERVQGQDGGAGLPADAAGDVGRPGLTVPQVAELLPRERTSDELAGRDGPGGG